MAQASVSPFGNGVQVSPLTKPFLNKPRAGSDSSRRVVFYRFCTLNHDVWGCCIAPTSNSRFFGICPEKQVITHFKGTSVFSQRYQLSHAGFGYLSVSFLGGQSCQLSQVVIGCVFAYFSFLGGGTYTGMYFPRISSPFPFFAFLFGVSPGKKKTCC